MIAGLARAGRMDVLRAAEALRAGQAPAHPRLHRHQPTLHMKYKLRMDAATRCSPPPSIPSRSPASTPTTWNGRPRTRTRSDTDFLCRCVEAAIGAGATTINMPDTVGYALPEDMERMFTMLRNRVPGIEKVILSTHNHNDLGLGVANTLAAIRAGARQVECTINGIGERAGNASLEEIVMAIRTRHDAVPCSNHHRRPSSCCASRSCSPPSPASTCSRTRRSSAATPSRTRRASIRTAC